MSNSKLLIDLGHAVGASGRYWVKVHDGNGNTLRESAPGKNILTNKFFADITGNSTVYSGCPIVGVGTTTPAATDTTLANYSGKCNSVNVLAGSYSYNDTPDANGYVYIKQTYVSHYLPGRISGSTPINLAEAGVSSDTIVTTTGSTAIHSRGLLVDGSGAPTTVPYNPATEYLDVYWELTLWFKAETSGTVSLNILGTPTSHSYVARIANWRKLASAANNLWSLPSTSINGIDFDISRLNIGNTADNNSVGTYACSGPIGTISQLPSGTVSRVTSISNTSSSQGWRQWTLTWGPSAGNVSGGIGCVFAAGGNLSSAFGTSWQISLSPNVNKTSMRYFDFIIRMSAGNYTP